MLKKLIKGLINGQLGSVWGENCVERISFPFYREKGYFIVGTVLDSSGKNTKTKLIERALGLTPLVKPFEKK